MEKIRAGKAEQAISWRGSYWDQFFLGVVVVVAAAATAAEGAEEASSQSEPQSQ